MTENKNPLPRKVEPCPRVVRVQIPDAAGDMHEYLLKCEGVYRHEGACTGSLTTIAGGFLVYEWPRVPPSTEALVG